MNASTFQDRWKKKILESSHFLEILEILLDNLHRKTRICSIWLYFGAFYY